MKLRIKGNSLRIRLDRRDLGQLLEAGFVEESLKFGPGPERTLTYCVRIGAAPRDCPQVQYSPGQITLHLHPDDAKEWHSSSRIGFSHDQVCEHETIHIVLEKDFACLERPDGEQADDEWAFPNPSLKC